MKKLILSIFILPFILGFKTADKTLLEQEFNLANKRTAEVQTFELKSELLNYGLDGERLGKDTFRFRLKCTPTSAGFEYTCEKYTINFGDSLEVSIPALANWQYKYEPGIDKANQVFGLDHSKFEGLVDENGNILPPDKSYHVYNSFIDFHGFCDVFGEQTQDGKGIQNLKKIGQKIVHAAANSAPPTNLGSNFAEGSFFKNGKITLEFNGLGLVNNKQCAIIGIDSGESSFNMIMTPMPNMEITTVGGSHYQGDIYKDIETGWVQKIVFDEVVISETQLPMPPNKINSVIERNIVISNLSSSR